MSKAKQPATSLVIHGHFHQPPREDPWLGEILPDGSAAPALHWTERIERSCYAPLAWARRYDSDGKILEIYNCYEWMSFSYDPKLLEWLERHSPMTYSRIILGDSLSFRRLGHGNAIAQIYHHQIFPLARELDREVATAWGIADFRAHFGRDPEGMWLAETAADLDSLDVLARYGIQYTILAPSQAEAVRTPGGEWASVNEESLDTSKPYKVRLPMGREMTVFFYNATITSALLNENLLKDGKEFCKRLGKAAKGGILSLVAPGETYGHFVESGEIALASVFDECRTEKTGASLSNFGTYLEHHPARDEVRLREPSSWSCDHGVERWRSDCGCSSGAHPEWNQKWRTPLRNALAGLKEKIDTHYKKAGRGLFRDGKLALLYFGEVIAGAQTPEHFATEHFTDGLTERQRDTAWNLLRMQQKALSSQASCAWLFDDIGGSEPENAMAEALYAMDLAKLTGGPDLQANFLAQLEQAESNLKELGSGAAIFRSRVLPRRESPETLASQAWLKLWAENRTPQGDDVEQVDWPALSVAMTCDNEKPGGANAPGGTVIVLHALTQVKHSFRWSVKDIATNEQDDPMDVCFTVYDIKDNSPTTCVPTRDLASTKRLGIISTWLRETLENQWQRHLSAARRGLAIFPPLEPFQMEPTLAEEWKELAPALAFCWIDGQSPAKGSLKDFVQFLKTCLATHPRRDDLRERLSNLGELLLLEDPVRFKDFWERCTLIEVQPDLWLLQNIWQEYRREMLDIGNLLGFKI